MLSVFLCERIIITLRYNIKSWIKISSTNMCVTDSMLGTFLAAHENCNLDIE